MSPEPTTGNMSIISLSEALSSFKFSTSRNDRITLSSLEAASDTGAGELPAEMLERVFLLLGPQDLNAVVLVCRRWRDVGEAPHLWTNTCVRSRQKKRKNSKPP